MQIVDAEAAAVHAKVTRSTLRQWTKRYGLQRYRDGYSLPELEAVMAARNERMIRRKAAA